MVFVGTTITQSANSIYSRLNTVSKMNFPLSIIPTYVVISQLYTHLILIIFALVIVIFNLGFSTINILELMYGLVASTLFLIALSF